MLLLGLYNFSSSVAHIGLFFPPWEKWKNTVPMGHQTFSSALWSSHIAVCHRHNFLCRCFVLIQLVVIRETSHFFPASVWELLLLSTKCSRRESGLCFWVPKQAGLTEAVYFKAIGKQLFFWEKLQLKCFCLLIKPIKTAINCYFLHSQHTVF